mmetsp:Transcript_126/g.439  ORF Transcript_126/g.439 Transcript_126/m.439 type:complete len:592 (-) Transcript_126:230-2005(-)
MRFRSSHGVRAGRRLMSSYAAARPRFRRVPFVVAGLGAGTVALYARWSGQDSTREKVAGTTSPERTGAALANLNRKTSWLRLLQLAWWLLPVFLFYPLQWICPGAYWSVVTSQLDRCGPCFVKLAQWLATRRDIFPDSFCEAMSVTHEEVQATWSPGVSVAAVQAQLEDAGLHLRTIDSRAHASGSIAQVFFAELEDGTPVALKCMRPGIRSLLDGDLAWLLRFGQWSAANETTRRFGLKRATQDFCEQVTMQTDLETEAANLRQFRINFSESQAPVRFPTPLFASPDVLVLTRERGTELARIFREVDDASAAAPGATSSQERARGVRRVIGAPRAVSEGIAKESMALFMRMIFHDAFIHGDLHPGNIMLRLQRPGSEDAPEDSMQRFRNRFARLRDRLLRKQPFEIVLLDAGLAIPLAQESVEALRSVGIAILYADYRRAADIIYNQSPDKSECNDPEGFKTDLATILKGTRQEAREQGYLELGKAALDSLRLVNEYKVEMDTGLTWIMLSMLSIEGSARQLFPEVDATAAAAKYIVTLPCLVRELNGGSLACAGHMMTQLLIEGVGFDYWAWRNHRKFVRRHRPQIEDE